jgi:hypothetical protein
MLIDTEYLVACVPAYSGFSRSTAGGGMNTSERSDVIIPYENENFPFRIPNLGMELIDG